MSNQGSTPGNGKSDPFGNGKGDTGSSGGKGQPDSYLQSRTQKAGEAPEYHPEEVPEGGPILKADCPPGSARKEFLGAGSMSVSQKPFKLGAGR